jgi:hypothetical protein
MLQTLLLMRRGVSVLLIIEALVEFLTNDIGLEKVDLRVQDRLAIRG